MRGEEESGGEVMIFKEIVKLKLIHVINRWTPKELIPTHIALAWVADCLVVFQNYSSVLFLS